MNSLWISVCGRIKRLESSLIFVRFTFRLIIRQELIYHTKSKYGIMKIFSEYLYTEQQKKRIFCIFGIVYKLGVKY